MECITFCFHTMTTLQAYPRDDLESQVGTVDIIPYRYDKITLLMRSAALSERWWLQLSSLLIHDLEVGSGDAPGIPRSAVKVSGRPGTILCCFLCFVMSLKTYNFLWGNWNVMACTDRCASS